MTSEQLKLQIDTDITGKTLVKSITPENVGENMKDIVDYVDENFTGVQNLQSILNEGSYAEVDGGNSYAGILDGDINDREVDIFISDGTNNSELSFNNINFKIGQQSNTDSALLSINNGIFKIEHFSLSGQTDIILESPVDLTTIRFPAKTITGNYTINTTPNTTYSVSTLPTGQLNDMAIVTDALSPTYLGALTGGGLVVCPVWHNGTTWVSR